MANIAKKTTFNLRSVLLAVLAFLILLGAGYKVFERNALKGLADLHRKSWSEELSIVEESGKRQEGYFKPIAKLTDPNLKHQDAITSIDELISATKLLSEDSNIYLQALRKNQEEYEKLVFPSYFLIGRAGSLARDILSNQIEYYKRESEAAKKALTGVHLYENTFKVWRDWLILNDFSNKTQASPEVNYPKYFPDIAVLEKYTRDTYKFDEEDKIKELYPENYEYLSKSEDYFRTYYQIAKDYVAGDYESALYKWPRLNQGSVDINPDFDRLFSEGEKESIGESKGIAESVFNLVKALKEFEKSRLGNYPLLGQLGEWKDDLILCQLYDYKSSIFNNVTKRYPVSKSTDELLKELNQVSPRTEAIDDKFDKNSLIFSNDDKEMKFECRDSDKTYTFKIIK